MPFFTQNISIELAKQIANDTTNPLDLLLNINHYIYNGMGIFIMLVAFLIILFLKNYYKSNDWMASLMYSSGVLAMVSLLFRGVYIYNEGVFAGMLYDWQMWIFPILAILIAMVIKMSDPE